MGIGYSKNAVKPETSQFFPEASKTPASGKQGLYQIQLIRHNDRRRIRQYL